MASRWMRLLIVAGKIMACFRLWKILAEFGETSTDDFSNNEQEF
jgi:hypothetical protein